MFAFGIIGFLLLYIIPLCYLFGLLQFLIMTVFKQRTFNILLFYWVALVFIESVLYCGVFIYRIPSMFSMYRIAVYNHELEELYFMVCSVVCVVIMVARYLRLYVESRIKEINLVENYSMYYIIWYISKYLIISFVFFLFLLDVPVNVEFFG